MQTAADGKHMLLRYCSQCFLQCSAYVTHIKAAGCFQQKFLNILYLDLSRFFNAKHRLSVHICTDFPFSSHLVTGVFC